MQLTSIILDESKREYILEIDNREANNPPILEPAEIRFLGYFGWHICAIAPRQHALESELPEQKSPSLPFARPQTGRQYSREGL